MPVRLRHVLRRPCKPCRLYCSNNSRSSRSAYTRPPLNYSEPQLSKQEQTADPEGNEPDLDDVVRSHWARDSPSAITRRSFSGIQPTGIPHLGNYLGALRQWKQLHDHAVDPIFAADHHYEQFFSVVDLHALTSDIPGPERAQLRKESFASLLAIGLNNNQNTTLFFQSDVSAPLHKGGEAID